MMDRQEGGRPGKNENIPLDTAELVFYFKFKVIYKVLSGMDMSSEQYEIWYWKCAK